MSPYVKSSLVTLYMIILVKLFSLVFYPLPPSSGVHLDKWLCMNKDRIDLRDRQLVLQQVINLLADLHTIGNKDKLCLWGSFVGEWYRQLWNIRTWIGWGGGVVVFLFWRWWFRNVCDFGQLNSVRRSSAYIGSDVFVVCEILILVNVYAVINFLGVVTFCSL